MRRDIKSFLETHKRRISPFLFFGGFVFDLFTLNQVDQLFDNFIILGHLIIISISIFLIHLGKRDQIFSNILERMILFAPFTLIFSFGGVLSGYVIFYTKSASVIANWPFLIVLYALFISSEIVFNKYQQTLFQVGMWFAATLTFTIFFVPIIIRTLGPWVFILSNVISIFIGWFFIHLLIRAHPPTQKYLAIAKTMFLSISFAFIAAYFLNIIPPIPLSMKDMDVYHNVYRDDAHELIGYIEEKKWYKQLSPIKEISIKPGDPVFAYNSIYSPTGINVDIKNIWEYKNTQGEWTEYTTVYYSLTGGRKDGFRWYSFGSPTPGSWRVRSTTTQGQEIGRVLFKVLHVTETPKLIKKVL